MNTYADPFGELGLPITMVSPEMGTGPETPSRACSVRYQARAEFLKGEDLMGQWGRLLAAEPLYDRVQLVSATMPAPGS
jgi:hypothetical protein